MEAKNINYNEEWLKGGLILAGVSILLTMLTYVIDVSLMVEWWFGVVSLLISMGLLIYLGINYRNDIGGILSYGDAFKFSFLVAEEKIQSVPLINLEELSPTFEEDKDELEKIIAELKTKDALIENEMRTIMSDHSGFNDVLKQLNLAGYGDSRTYGDYD